MGLMTLAEARTFLAAAVDTQGRDFIYNTRGGMCFYVPQHDFGDGDPKAKTGCLVGVALSLVGHTQEELGAESGGILDRMEELHLSEKAAEYLGIAQGVQDLGKTWGQAHDAAEEWACRQS